MIIRQNYYMNLESVIIFLQINNIELYHDFLPINFGL